MADNSTTIRVALVVALLAIVMIALTFMPKPASGPINAPDAQQVVLKDVRMTYPQAELEILQTDKVQEGRWKVRVKIALNAHQACPSVYVRDYELLPILFREERVVGDCRAGIGPIVYPEEALLRSEQVPQVKDASQTANYYGCAVRTSEANTLAAQCASARQAALNLSATLPGGSWLAAWVSDKDANNATFIVVGLDRDGGVLQVVSGPQGS